MKKVTTSAKKVFSLQECFKGKVKRLTLHFQDIDLSESKDKKEPNLAGWVFGTLQLFIEGNKETVENVNFHFSLGVNTDLKNHVTAIIKEAIKNNEKKGGK